MKAPLHQVSADWFRIIWDLVQHGHNLSAIEEATGIKHSTLRGYLDGSQPPHWRGELLIDMWCKVCKRRRSELHAVDVIIAPRVVQPAPQVQADPDAVKRLEKAWRA